MIGWAHVKLIEKANEGDVADQIEGRGGVGGAIERLEENLTKQS